MCSVKHHAQVLLVELRIAHRERFNKRLKIPSLEKYQQLQTLREHVFHLVYVFQVS